jgi:putative ABC transport system substrate-binding protein
MSERRRFLAGLGAGSLILASDVRAQAESRLPRIGWLYSTEIKAATRLIDAFLEGLREQGYVEGRNVLIERRFADGHFERVLACEGTR